MTRSNLTLDGHRIELVNVSKVLFPESDLSKRDVIDYYRRIADVALKHYRNRPVSMQRFPDGIGADGFFQKDRPDYFPAWIASRRLSKQNGSVDHVLVNDRATLVYLANQACITLHLGLAHADSPHKPNRLIFDLDPPGDGDFALVRTAALRLKSLLDDLELKSFLQTTGSRGLHVVVPLDARADFDRVRAFARRVAETLAARFPDSLTIEQRRKRRRGRVYIDYLRNAWGQTAVAPYSIRALEGAPVATPIRWDELTDRRLHAQRYHIGNIRRRLGQLEDPWTHIARSKQAFARAESVLNAQN